MILHADGGALADGDGGRQGHVQPAIGVGIVLRRQPLAVDLDGVDRKVAVEIQRKARDRCAGQEGQPGVADDAALRRIHAQAQVGVFEHHRQLLGRALGAGIEGVVAGRARGAGRQEQAGTQQRQFFHGRGLAIKESRL